MKQTERWYYVKQMIARNQTTTRKSACNTKDAKRHKLRSNQNGRVCIVSTSAAKQVVTTKINQTTQQITERLGMRANVAKTKQNTFGTNNTTRNSKTCRSSHRRAHLQVIQKQQTNAAWQQKQNCSSNNNYEQTTHNTITSTYVDIDSVFGPAPLVVADAQLVAARHHVREHKSICMRV